jgi:putative ABC transport system permease protein
MLWRGGETMSMFRQIGAVTLMNLRSVPQRWGTSLVIVVGIAGVVAVLISVLAMATGFRQTVAGSGRADRALVLRGGSESELSSSLSRDATLTIVDAPGVKKGDNGRPIGSAEAVVIVELPKKGSTTGANVTLRGVGSEAFALRPEIKLVAGRMFTPALHELIVGRSAQLQFQGLDLGSHLTIRGGDWTVVGMFESNGDSHESELLADADTVLSAYQRNLFQSVWVLLDSPQAFTGFKDALTANPTLSVEVKREPDYYAAQSKQLSTILTFVANFVGGIMAIGAVFGALNTMYSAVSARMVEIATLRAIGFGAFPVVISVFAEAVLLAFAGGVIGALLAWLFFNGDSVSTLGGNFTQIVFSLKVSSGLLVLGVVWAVAIGVIGGLFPAIRAARLPIATALRAT